MKIPTNITLGYSHNPSLRSSKRRHIRCDNPHSQQCLHCPKSTPSRHFLYELILHPTSFASIQFKCVCVLEYACSSSPPKNINLQYIHLPCNLFIINNISLSCSSISYIVCAIACCPSSSWLSFFLFVSSVLSIALPSWITSSNAAFRISMIHRSHNTLSVLLQLVPLISPSKYRANTSRRHWALWMNAVMASSSTCSIEYSLMISRRFHPRLCCTRVTTVDWLTSPFRPPRPDCWTKLVNPYGRSIWTTYTIPSILIPVPNAPVATIHPPGPWIHSCKTSPFSSALA